MPGYGEVKQRYGYDIWAKMSITPGHKLPLRQLKANQLFYNDRTPRAKVGVLGEKPWHRQAIELALAGQETNTIALALGKGAQYVSTLLRQDWVRERMAVEAQKRAACDEIREILETEGPASLKRVVSMAKEKAGTPLGFEADKEILNRLLGRPTQPISTDTKPVKELDFDELKQQVNRIVTGVPGTNGNSDGPRGVE